MAGRERGRDELAVAVVAGGLGFGGPDRVQDGEVVGAGQVTLPDHGGGQLGAVAAQDVREHGDRLTLFWPGWLRAEELGQPVTGAFAAGAVVAAEFGGSAGGGLRVGGPGGGGEHERQVGVGAAGHGRVQPLTVLAAGDQRDAGVHRGALGRVPGDRVSKIGRLVAVIAEGPVGEPPLARDRIRAEHPADHDAAAGDGLDPQDVPIGHGPAGLTRLEAVVVGPADDQVPGRGLGCRG